MPIFSSTSHVQISGGNFVEIGGDFNIQTSLPSEDIDSVLRGLGRLHNIQPSQPAGGVDNMLVDLERLRLGEDSGRQLLGPVRTTMRRGNARMRRPYGASGALLRFSTSQDSQRPLNAPCSKLNSSNRRQLMNPRHPETRALTKVRLAS
jgi:hypothetical protein